MSVPQQNEFFVDPSRCIGCRACVAACAECDTHKGVSLIQLDEVDRPSSPQTVPVVCMHCHSPTCAEVCPAHAITKTADGVVQSASKPRCIACNNCVLACPFGIPKMQVEFDLMMKCDMCYDRTSIGLKPMCASVCPSQALFFGTREDIERQRPRSRPTNRFRFGRQTITTKVHMMTPRGRATEHIDVTESMDDAPARRHVSLHVIDDALFEAGTPASGGGDTRD